VTLSFKRATKYAAKLRMAFVGPSGSGKTYSSLAVATGLGGRIAVVDSERGSASKYADLFEFDVLELDSCAPEMYVQAIRAAEQAGYDIVVVDSLSHAWMGKDGALEMVDRAARREQGNSFGAWRHVTPKHNAMVEAIVSSSCHVIVTMRAKTEWVIEDVKGKKVPRKIGLAPVQRNGLEFEFDVVGDLDQDNMYVVTKTRCPSLAGAAIHQPGAELAETLRAWLAGPAADPPQPTDLTVEPDPDLVAKLELSIAQAKARKARAMLESLKEELRGVPESPAKQRLRQAYKDAAAAMPAHESHEPSPSPSPDPPASTSGPSQDGPTTTETSRHSEQPEEELPNMDNDGSWSLPNGPGGPR
jgi:hypothetical protein